MQTDEITLTLDTTSSVHRASLLTATGKSSAVVFIVAPDEAYDYSELGEGEIHFYSSSRPRLSEAFQTMLASEHILAKDWDSPEEDEAWADL